MARGVMAASAVVAATVLAVARGATDQCGTPTNDVLAPLSGVPGCGLSNEVSMSSCCGNNVGGAAIQGGDGGCRFATMETPFCSNPNFEGGCTSGTPESSHTWTLDMSMLYAPSDEVCCNECTCYGDPLCVSFDGKLDQYIECDGRNFTDCTFDQQICRQQRDWGGNRCKWVKNNDNFPWWTSNLESGSPCQADYNTTGYLDMVMYDKNGLKFSTTVGERGTLSAFQISLPGSTGQYSITSDDCFANDPRNVGASAASGAWSLPVGASDIPTDWSVSTANNIEIRWTIAAADLGVYVDVVCTKAEGALRSRLDIENVIDTQENDGTGNGVCFTGQIDTGRARGSNMGPVGVKGHEKCLELSLPKLEFTCKVLSKDNCNYNTVGVNKLEWCSSADLTKTDASAGASPADRTEKCLEDLNKGSDQKQAETWLRYACQMNVPDNNNNPEAYVEECILIEEQLGWDEWRAKYQSLIPRQFEVADYCGLDLTQYMEMPESEECAGGVMVQVEKSAGSWENVFYIPDTFPPCPNADLTAHGDDYPELFMYPVRLKQCGLDAKCHVTSPGGTDCRPLSEVTASMSFGGISCKLEDSCKFCEKNFDDLPPTVCGEDAAAPFELGSCEQCCETNNFLPGQGEQSCRDVEMNQPYCDPSNPETAPYCQQLRRSSSDGLLRLVLTAPQEGFSRECCKTCSVWGDPFAEAFDGSREKLIICDSRVYDECLSSEALCSQLKDHAGNDCVWNQSVADLISGKRANIGAYGSPCLPDFAKSGDAVVEMYSTGEFDVRFTTGERSILTSMILTTANGRYELDPEGCFDESQAYPGWTALEGDDVQDALVLDYTRGGEEGYGSDERAWAITDVESGIFIKLVCALSRSSTSSFVGGYRINVEKIIDTDLDRADSAAGYCVSGNLVQYGGGYTPNPEAERCEDSLGDDHLAAKAFWYGSATPHQVPKAIEAWCTTANTGMTVKDCVDAIYRRTRNGRNRERVGANWLNMVCTALLPLKGASQSNREFIRGCEEIGETDGYFAVVEEYGSAGDRASVQDASQCTSSPSDYGMRADTDACITGIEVQYHDGSDWVELFFMPSNNLPCNGVLEIRSSVSKYYPLFTSPIRLVQCDVDPAQCDASENTAATCMSAFGYQAEVQFTHGDIGCPP